MPESHKRTYRHPKYKDSRDLKFCSQGEWHAKRHGETHRKRWKKLHSGVDAECWIITSTVTDGHEQDPLHVQALLAQVDPEIDAASGLYVRDICTGYGRPVAGLRLEV